MITDNRQTTVETTRMPKEEQRPWKRWNENVKSEQAGLRTSGILKPKIA